MQGHGMETDCIGKILNSLPSPVANAIQLEIRHGATRREIVRRAKGIGMRENCSFIASNAKKREHEATATSFR